MSEYSIWEIGFKRTPIWNRTSVEKEVGNSGAKGGESRY
jgi:hypothetical protein